MPLILEKLQQGDRVTFDPHGTSMRPMLRQGIDRIELAPITRPLKKYDLPLYIRDSGQYVLHRIVKVGKTYTCMGDNQRQKEPGIRPDQMLAVTSGFYRGEKYHSVGAWYYKLYCRLWPLYRPVRPWCHRGKRLLRRLLKR